MTITKTKNGNTMILSIAGKLDTLTSPELREEIDNIFTEGAVNLVFDLEALEYLSSAGLGVLAHTVKRATAAGTEVHVTGATGIVKEVLDITRLSTLMGKS
jgi:anti-sigma B factor antagonist